MVFADGDPCEGYLVGGLLIFRDFSTLSGRIWRHFAVLAPSHANAQVRESITNPNEFGRLQGGFRATRKHSRLEQRAWLATFQTALWTTDALSKDPVRNSRREHDPKISAMRSLGGSYLSSSSTAIIQPGFGWREGKE